MERVVGYKCVFSCRKNHQFTVYAHSVNAAMDIAKRHDPCAYLINCEPQTLGATLTVK